MNKANTHTRYGDLILKNTILVTLFTMLSIATSLVSALPGVGGDKVKHEDHRIITLPPANCM